MSFERSISRSMPFLPRYRSVSSCSPQSPRRFPTVRSRSQPTQRIAFFQGTASKFIAYPRQGHSPSPQRVFMISLNGKKKTTKSPLTRISRSGSHNDLYSSHIYTTLEPVVDEDNVPKIEVDARAASCGDIYHKGPFFPDASQSESGVSMNYSSSLYSAEDDNASQISCGSSTSAFHEITIDSELDRLDVEDGGLKSPRSEYGSWFRFRDRQPSPDSSRSSPSLYADSKKRELMSSPSWDFDKTSSRFSALRVSIPTASGSAAKEKLTPRKERTSSSSSTTPLAQSTPQASPRSFMGPKLSIKGSWNADDPSFHCDESNADSDYHSLKRMDDSSCYSSLSEDCLSDVSPRKVDKRKVKLTKKASDAPSKRSDLGQFTSHGQNHLDQTLVSEESFDNVYVPPLESVIGEENDPANDKGEQGASWWAVFNIGSANARLEEDTQNVSSDNEAKQEIKIVKPADTGIPLISPGKYGQEKLKRYSQSSPPPDNGSKTPESPSICLPGDQSDVSPIDEGDNASGDEREPLVKQNCRERVEDVLKKTTQDLTISTSGAFDIVSQSGRGLDQESTALSTGLLPSPLGHMARVDERITSINDKVNELSSAESESENSGEMRMDTQGAQPMNNDTPTGEISPNSLSLQSSLNGTMSFTTMEEELNESVDKTKQQQQEARQSIFKESKPPTLQLTNCGGPAVFAHNDACEQQSLSPYPNGQTTHCEEPASDLNPLVCQCDVDSEDDGSDNRPKEANSRHYVLDNNNTRGQDAGTEAILSVLHIPGGESLQVAQSASAEVGGSGSACSVGTTGLREEESDLTTSTTPRVGRSSTSDNTIGFPSPYPFSVGAAADESANGIQFSENNNSVHSRKACENGVDALCSEFTAVLNISDPDETLVHVGESQEERLVQKDDSDANRAVISLDSTSGNETREEGEDQHSPLNNARANLKSDEVVLTSPAADDGDTVVDNKFEILGGHVGLEEEETRQTSQSSSNGETQDAENASADEADHKETADRAMEWTFIDLRHKHAVSTPCSGGDEWGRTDFGEEGGLNSRPHMVTVLATAQLPRQTGTDDVTGRHDVNGERRDPSQDYDSEIIGLRLHGEYPCLLHANQEQNNIINNNINTDIQQGGEDPDKYYYTSEKKADGLDRSINYSDVRGDSYGDNGIPRIIKTDAQNNNEDGDEGPWSREQEFSSHSPSDPAFEARAEAHSVASSQQVKRIRRKTVEETVTIERSSSCSSGGGGSSGEAGGFRSNGHLEQCDHRVEYITTNRKETVIHQEDHIFTSPGQVSTVFLSPSADNNVSNEPCNINSESPLVPDLTTPATHSSFVTSNQGKRPYSNDPSVPSSSSAPKSVHAGAATICVDTPNAFSTPLNHSDITASRSRSPPSAELRTPAMKWRAGLTDPASQTTSFDPSFDPSLDPGVRVRDNSNSMAIVAERDTGMMMKPASRSSLVTHHSALDQLQAQLSHISAGGDGFDLTSPSSNKAFVYHDRGQATTAHVLNDGGEVTGKVNNAPPAPGSGGGLALSPQSSTLGIPSVEIYDNDYDYVTDDDHRKTSLHPPHRQHHLLKSGHNILKTSSSLWTLKEETDSLLEAISPIASPKRSFSTFVEGLLEDFPPGDSRNNINDNSHNNNEATSYFSELEQPKVQSIIHPIYSSNGPRPTFEQTQWASQSSDMDESDGNYSSISTVDSSSYRSSSYSREQTPLSDSDNGISGDYRTDKVNCFGQASPSQGKAQAVDGFASFNEFVSGLETERITSDWDSQHAPAPTPTPSNVGLDQQTPVEFEFEDSPDGTPTHFKSSVAFCVSAAAPTRLQSFQRDGEVVSLGKSGDESNAQITEISHTTSTPSMTAPSFGATVQQPLASRLAAGIPLFPVDEDSFYQSSNPSTHCLSDDAASEASSRLHTLDLDLSRISSCASPAPSDLSDGSSMFTCQGTAEVKRGHHQHSVSFEDDIDMVPISSWHIPTSTPKPLKSALKKPAVVKVDLESVSQHDLVRDSKHEIWVKQFDKILEDFNAKTSALGPDSDVIFVGESGSPDTICPTTGSESQGSGFNDMYKEFTNDDSEKKQNHLCPVVESDNISTFRFKRFLKKSHTKRSSKGRRIVRFFSRLSCVSESVSSPDLSATRKKARLDNGDSYSTELMPPPPERVLQRPTSPPIHSHNHQSLLSQSKDIPTSSNHSLDSCPSRTDSAYSSVSESFSSTINNSPKELRLSSARAMVPSSSSSRSFSSVSFSEDSAFHSASDSSDRFYLNNTTDSVHSSTSDYPASLRPFSESSTDPFSPGPVPGGHSKEVLTALSDVFNQLDVCEGEIDTALLDRLRSGHHAVHFSKDA